ncbi:hypothetical protein VP01_2973g2 [Puccinia sorghi]|uniref:Uncharacterized protein n=1 Tax=Puccinia sorghi TaxID=27349 RepID=A0A0L6V1I3_9BASI|nr:hypothetical protein VP01_2973g2 [Puccinia sorghi]
MEYHPGIQRSLTAFPRTLGAFSRGGQNSDEYQLIGPQRAIPPEVQKCLRQYLANHPESYLSKVRRWLLEHFGRLSTNISLKTNHWVNSNWSDLRMGHC